MFIINDERQRKVRHFWLYAIALEQGKYYVGITSRKNPFDRLKQHGTSFGASWTRKYKPLRPIQPLMLKKLGVMTLAQAEKYEQKAFEEYRKLYGTGNVRGGRIVSRGPIFRLGGLYFNEQMLSNLTVIMLLLLVIAYLYLRQRS